MRQIRRSVFETNSSSTHSISYNRLAPLEECTMVPDEAGYIHASFGEFGWEIKDYYNQPSKLSYLLTMAAQLSGYYPNSWTHEDHMKCLEEFQKSEVFTEISEAVADYADCKGIVMDDDTGYIDHQSADYNSFDEFLRWNDVGIIDFVFGGVVVHTDNDNY